MFELKINDFEGPLDLLLHLVKKEKLDIYQIDINKIIDAYLDFIKSIDPNDLDQSSEYLVMASELIHLKSRLLVNEEIEEDDEEYEFNTEEDLKNRLIEYEAYKKISESLKELEEKRGSFLTKEPSNLNEYKKEVPLEQMDLNSLINALLELNKRKEYEKPIQTKITKKELSVEDKTKYINNILTKKKKVSFIDLFEVITKEEIIVTFLSILNMSKDKIITIYQENNFKDIIIERI